MAAQFNGVDPVLVGPGPGREGGDDLFLAEGLDLELGRRVLGEQGEGGIHPVLLQVGTHIPRRALMEVDLDPGKRLAESDQEPRHVDSLWPLWNVLELTPEGRGTDWNPSVSYS